MRWPVIVGLAFVALVVSGTWGTAPFTRWPISVLRGAETDAQLVRRFFPRHIVNPDRFQGNANAHAAWAQAETEVRLGIIWAGWLALIVTGAVLDRKAGRREPRRGQSGPNNQT